MKPPPDTASVLTQIATLQAELDSLQDRYDTLLEAKNRAAERYKADYKKWRDFKRWLFRDVESDEDVQPFLKSDEFAAYTKVSALGKRKQFEESGPNMEHELGIKQESIRDVKFELSYSSPVASRHQRRKSYHGESSQKVLSPSPSSNKDPFLVPQSNTRADKSSMLDDNVEMPCRVEPSRSTPFTEPRKRKGRYAQVPSETVTINSRFSIRKDKNDGMDFQYDAVVRNREERKHMLGSDCECCREYYEAVGPLPASRQPLWRTPTKRKTPCNLHPLDNKENTDEVEEHKQRISRHRHHWHRPKTPPGYWDIGFPDTQEVLDINRRAAEMHKRKLVEVETEAKNDSGRYTKRAPRAP
ncbi:DNA repair protein endonuclease SAE2/CtIP C-terminus-domain-containing protein [Boletus edulis]|nr:DNA repair protein endonuclease SAE2/CtIP C-terminus-domain-containing protein [Boletus edulis]